MMYGEAEILSDMQEALDSKYLKKGTFFKAPKGISITKKPFELRTDPDTVPATLTRSFKLHDSKFDEAQAGQINILCASLNTCEWSQRAIVKTLRALLAKCDDPVMKKEISSLAHMTAEAYLQLKPQRRD